MSAVWFTSDLHIGHATVAAMRIPPDIILPAYLGAVTDWHDTTLAKNWDALIKPDDVVWVLGDISAGGAKAQREALRWIANRPGYKHLIAGNHDGCHPMYRDAHRWQPEYLMEAFESVQPFARRRIAGRPVLLSHFPYDGDHTERSRFDQYRLRNYGEPLLHGHTHSSERVSYGTDVFDSGLQWGMQVHVGVDAWGLAPVPLAQLESIILDGST